MTRQLWCRSKLQHASSYQVYGKIASTSAKVTGQSQDMLHLTLRQREGINQELGMERDDNKAMAQKSAAHASSVYKFKSLHVAQSAEC